MSIKLKHNPTSNQRITSKFGVPRSGGRSHDGVDIGGIKAGVPGDPIYAVADGTVIVSKANRDNPATGLGWYVTIDHGGWQSIYAHLFTKGVNQGAKVIAGEMIGRMGYSGEVSPRGVGGTHLHFGVCTGYNASDVTKSKWVDPEPLFLKAGGETCEKGNDMKTVKKGSIGEAVKILQACIGVNTDGSFGPATDKAFRAWQKSKGLTVDGSCGPASWRALGFVPSKSSGLYVLRIPYGSIEFCRVSLKDKNKNYSVLRHAQETGADLAINGAMFSMDTYQNVTDLIVNGVINNGGNYSDKGIAFGNPWAGISAYQSTTANSAGKKVDFIGGAPPLIMASAKVDDLKGLDKAFWTTRRQRMAAGISSDSLYIITGGQTNNVSLDEVQAEGVFQGLTALINLDGGASTALYINGRAAFSGRNVPSALVIKRRA
jgi:peptidoglycan hydrolase-like protein with peptidoglycan-binding domain